MQTDELAVVYERDSVYVYRTDTLLLTRETRDRVVYQTVCRTDTVTVERIEEREVVQQHRVTPRWCRWLLLYALLLTLALLVRLLLRLYRRFMQ